jgi:hypothetical protein
MMMMHVSTADAVKVRFYRQYDHCGRRNPASVLWCATATARGSYGPLLRSSISAMPSLRPISPDDVLCSIGEAANAIIETALTAQEGP